MEMRERTLSFSKLRYCEEMLDGERDESYESECEPRLGRRCWEDSDKKSHGKHGTSQVSARLPHLAVMPTHFVSRQLQWLLMPQLLGVLRITTRMAVAINCGLLDPHHEASFHASKHTLVKTQL